MKKQTKVGIEIDVKSYIREKRVIIMYRLFIRM